MLPANAQEAWTHPSKEFLFVAWNNGASYSGVRGEGPAGNMRGVSGYPIDRTTGALILQGESAALSSLPIYIRDRRGWHAFDQRAQRSQRLGCSVHFAGGNRGRGGSADCRA